MQRTEEENERIAIIMEGCHYTEAQAIESMRVRHDFTHDVQKLKELATLQRMKSKRGIDRKLISSGG